MENQNDMSGKRPQVRWFPKVAALATLLACLCLAGCSKQLLGAIDEVSANQVVSSLRLEGIAADKVSAGDKVWKVMVADADFAQAVQILERRNLPPPQFEGLGQMFKKESLVSTPTEERARLIHAMSQELERSLMEIDGVLVARVHPVILPHDPLNPKRATATASVLIKYRAGIDMSGREGMVRALVAAGVEGLNYDDVRVVMVPAEARPAVPTAGVSTPNSLAQSPVPVLYIGVVAAIFGAMVLSYLLVRWRRKATVPAQALKGRWARTVSGFAGEHRTDSEQPAAQRGERSR